MPAIDETVAITRDDEWQYVRIPLSVPLPYEEVHLHRDTADGPITLSATDPGTKRQSGGSLEEFFRLVDEAVAAGESFELERKFCPPRDVEL